MIARCRRRGIREELGQAIVEQRVLVLRVVHQARHASERVQLREEDRFFGVVVVIDGPAPAVDKGEGISNVLVARDVRRLLDDGIEASDEDVVGLGHELGRRDGGMFLSLENSQYVYGWSPSLLAMAVIARRGRSIAREYTHGIFGPLRG